MAQTDPYDVLGVSRDASPDEIKAAYRRLVRRYHPDVNPNDPTCEQKLKDVNDAYERLTNPQREAQDQFGQGGVHFESANFGDIFEMFFGGQPGGGGGRRRSPARPGQHVQVSLRLTLAEVVTGVTREITYQRFAHCDLCHGTGGEGGAAPTTCETCQGAGVVNQVRNTLIGQMRTTTECPTCHGSGAVIKQPCSKCRGRGLLPETKSVEVQVPAGIESGSHMQMPGLGGDGTNGGEPGALLILLEVEDNPRFERDGTTLYTAVEVSFAQATLGDEVEFDGVDAPVALDLPSGTQPGTRLTVKNAGMPPLHGGRRGDLIVQVQVRVPRQLNDEQRRLVRELAEASGENLPKGDSKGGLLGGLFGKKK